MKDCNCAVLVLIAAAGLVSGAHAHRAWILPDATILSGDDPWVTFDAAISNDIFYTDYVPMRGADLKAIGPDGTPASLANLSTGRYRTTFDLNLTQRGTYKIFSASYGLTARWQDENGDRQSYPRRGEVPTAEGFAARVPEQAEGLEVSQSSRRLETFVTAGAPDAAVFEPAGEGLEFVPVTHPNDLFDGESAEFRFVIDGEPAAGVEVSVVPDGMRYRDDQQEIVLESDGDGRIELRWPGAGRYYLQATYRDEHGKAPATFRTGHYAATFEVLPQ